MKEMEQKRSWTQGGHLKCYWHNVLYGLVVVVRKTGLKNKAKGNLKVESKELENLSYWQLGI